MSGLLFDLSARLAHCEEFDFLTASKHSKQMDMPTLKSLTDRRASNDVEGGKQLRNHKTETAKSTPEGP
jgi:hypothetical protein